MERTEQHLWDKSKFIKGLWTTEPDRVTFEAHGLPVILRRHESHGHWCGYVGVPEGHPCYGIESEYSDPIPHDVHGGCTYSRKCDENPETGVCHLKKAGEPERWWLGFDFNHLGDESPYSITEYGYCRSGSYRSIVYVEQQARNYAKVLSDMK